MSVPEPQYSPLLELTKARIREFFREKGIVFWVFGFPLLMAMGLGLAFRNQPEVVPSVAVFGPDAALVAATLRESHAVDATAVTQTAGYRGLARAKYDVLVEASSPSAYVLHLDPTQQRAPLARAVVRDVLERAAGRQDRLNVVQKPTTQPGGRYIDFLLPGLIGLNLMGSSMWGVGYNLVVARKRRLLRRYAVTPMRRWHFLVSYFLSRALFLVAELTVLVLFGALVFDTRMQGSVFAFGTVAFAGAASFGALSLLVGARVDNTEVANGWMNFLQLPMWVLSGAFFSYERFPEWLHGPIKALPLTAVIDGLRATFNDGASIVQCWSQLLVLVVWGSVGFVVAVRGFRWQ